MGPSEICVWQTSDGHSLWTGLLPGGGGPSASRPADSRSCAHPCPMRKGQGAEVTPLDASSALQPLAASSPGSRWPRCSGQVSTALSTGHRCRWPRQQWQAGRATTPVTGPGQGGSATGTCCSSPTEPRLGPFCRGNRGPGATVWPPRPTGLGRGEGWVSP